MDFVKREESNLIDEENYKIYMESVSKYLNLVCNFKSLKVIHSFTEFSYALLELSSMLYFSY